jgi:myo-inositol-1-phosphate synthase
MPEPIRIAVVGVGNCASSLIQGIAHYGRLERQGTGATPEEALGLMHHRIGPYGPGDIEVVAAFDIDERKVGRPVGQAIFAPPNNTAVFHAEVPAGPVVQMGDLLDGMGAHMAAYPENRRFVPAKRPVADIERVLRESRAEVLVNYLPVGSQAATERYARACLETGVSLVNCMPVFIVSEEGWGARFQRAGIPCVGDDIKAQVGATIVHRVLARLFRDRGVALDHTYQLNVGGNTDFLNMLEHSRLASKKVSKTEAVQSQLETPMPAEDVHIGPSDFVPWMKDNKVCFLRMEGRGFGGVPLNLELRLSVEDSPNSAGVAVDAIRCCKLARDRGIAGPLTAVSAYCMKHPPQQLPDTDARDRMNDFIAGKRER